MQPFLDGLSQCLGPAGLVTDPAEMAPHLTDWRRMFSGPALAVLRPGSTDQVSAAVRLCAQHGIAIVPQRGNTGLAGGATPMGGLPAAMEATLAAAFGAGLVLDGTLAASARQAQSLWALREHLTEAEARCGKSLKHDVSRPLRRMDAFLDSVRARLAELAPAARLNIFGHLGDGNLHVHVIPGDTPLRVQR